MRAPVALFLLGCYYNPKQERNFSNRNLLRSYHAGSRASFPQARPWSQPFPPAVSCTFPLPECVQQVCPGGAPAKEPSAGFRALPVRGSPACACFAARVMWDVRDILHLESSTCASHIKGETRGGAVATGFRKTDACWRTRGAAGSSCDAHAGG